MPNHNLAEANGAAVRPNVNARLAEHTLHEIVVPVAGEFHILRATQKNATAMMSSREARACMRMPVEGTVAAHRNATLQRKNSAAVVAPDAPVLHCMVHSVQVVYENVPEIVVGVALGQ